MFALSSLLIGAIASPLVNAVGLTLKDTFSGNDFFTGFSFNASAIDPTNFGNIHYADQSTAQSATAPLAFVDGSGNVILKVDNTTNANGDPNFGRNTVMMISKDTININTLLVLDVNHIPFGCSVWPAFWTINADLATKPGADVGGEIDIIEAVNLQTTNSYSLHTASGCTLATEASFPFSGKAVQTNCDGVDFNVTGNQGCVITEPQSNSVGQNFAGGVYAMYWSTAGIQIWFFPRASVPADLSSNSPDPSTWPTPSASYAASGCDPTKFFQPQNIVIDIDVCGAFAGEPHTFAATCSGTCIDLVGTASNYNSAYWDITSIKTFTSASSGSSNSTSSASPSSSASKSSSSAKVSSTPSTSSSGSSNSTGSASGASGSSGTVGQSSLGLIMSIGASILCAVFFW